MPPTSAPSPVARMVVAFDEPGGRVLGPILLPTAALARYGDTWIQVVHDGGRVWVRSSDAPSLALAGLADLAPPTPAPIVVQPPVAPPAAVEPTAHTTNHARPDDRPGPPTPVSPFTIR